MDLRTQSRLQEVVDKGAPGQAEHAEQLLARVNSVDGALPESLVEEAAALFDAYLNDPYLTRQPEGPDRRD